MMSAGAEAPAELLITSMRLREQAEAAAESPLERLLHAVDIHAAAEAAALGQYEYLAVASGYPVIAFVMRLILDDEVRHHGLLHRMSTTLRDALEWTASAEALPTGAPQARVPGAYVTLARSLIEEERTGARALRRLADREKDINGGLDSLLLGMMAMDSEKHARLLQFVQIDSRREPTINRSDRADYYVCTGMRVVIADDHPLFRDGLRSLLELRGVEVIGEAKNGREAVDHARRLRPDVVLMDLDMPELGGLDATRLISAEQPDVKVVVLTASEDDANLFEAIKSGAQGYLFKNLDSNELVRLLDGVARGEPALTPGLARKLLGEFARPPAPAQPVTTEQAQTLTEREREVLNLLVQGITSNRELAERLVVTENTVKYHLRNILDKLHLQNRAQVVGYAVRHGMVNTSDQPG